MITRVLDANGNVVTQVKPGTKIQLSVGGGGFWTSSAHFVVVDSNGANFVDVVVPLNPFQNAWLDWVAPLTPGNYRFYGNIDTEPDAYVDFTVSPVALYPETAPSGIVNVPQASTNWWWPFGGGTSATPAAPKDVSKEPDKKVAFDWTPIIIAGAVILAIVLLAGDKEK